MTKPMKRAKPMKRVRVMRAIPLTVADVSNRASAFKANLPCTFPIQYDEKMMEIMVLEMQLSQLLLDALASAGRKMCSSQRKLQIHRYKRTLRKGGTILYERGNRKGQLILPSRAAKKARYDRKLLSMSFKQGKPSNPRVSDGGRKTKVSNGFNYNEVRTFGTWTNIKDNYD
tara:strand:+ start:117 stop:632 length:516 start_codon:yes stop_codon:yes gene_type:complete